MHSNSIKKVIGLNIGILREEKGYSREELAGRSGVSDVTIWRIETGSANYCIDSLESVCAALGVTIADVCSESSLLDRETAKIIFESIESFVANFEAINDHTDKMKAALHKLNPIFRRVKKRR